MSKITYIAGFINRSAHDNNLFSTQERLWVLCSRKSKVGQGTNGNNGDRVGLILAENPQHFLMRGLFRSCKRRVVLCRFLEFRKPGMGRGVEEGFVGVRREEMGVLLLSD